MNHLLAIETSCDETAAAILRWREHEAPELITEQISSQSEIHRQYGGVVPELASREHLRNLPLLVETVLRDAKLDLSRLAAVAATIGPGLKGCLLIGSAYAKAISLARGIPFLGVNHIEGHLLAPMLDNPQLAFPFLALVVSGGHTELHHVRGIGEYELLARTTDDAAGEAFDKSAHLLGFEYPGGAALAALADSCPPSAQRGDFALPRVMRGSPSFSFSGLKTAISLLIARQSALREDPSVRAALAASIQESIVAALISKLEAALTSTRLRSVVVTGGVSANRALREAVARVCRDAGAQAFFPSIRHCMDNAAMIGYAAAVRFQRGETWDLSAGTRSRWPVETMRPATAGGQ